MSSPSERSDRTEVRVYDRRTSVVFLKTHEEFGGLSNMAGGFPLTVNRLRIFTAEALYQACRFPHMPELQRLVIGQASPMTAKMKGKPYRDQSRPDWERVRVKVMRWCLRVKLAQNWASFSDLLLRTGDRPIVEHSRKDDFWGAKETEDGALRGRNVLGRLLMELREVVRRECRDALLRVEPLAIPQFLLDGQPVEVVQAEAPRERPQPRYLEVAEPAVEARGGPRTQGALFEQPAVKEGTAPYLEMGAARRAVLFGLPTYPVMKDSGVGWLGQVPAHWDVLPNRAVFAEARERDRPAEQMLSVTITRGVIRQEALLTDGSKKDSSNQDKTAYKLVRPGDIAYNKMRAWQGAIGVSDYQGIVSPAYVVQRPRQVGTPRYLDYLLRTPRIRQGGRAVVLRDHVGHVEPTR